MQNNIPLPTDNIYKFYALFGLLLFIFAVGATLYVNNSTNNLLVDSVVELESLKIIENPTAVESAKRQLLEQRIEVTLEDKEFYKKALAALSALGFWLMGYGFWKWHREIQPIQDEIARLQRDKLRSEVASFNQPPGTAPASPSRIREENA
jgi:hypothetical protein